MPYLRFSRDKRGYENTYVFHTAKEDGKPRPRMLYWFRTPPHVKVGRMPLDESAIREIEANNPDIVFDWNRILKVRATPKPDKASYPQRGGRRRSPRGTESGKPASDVQGTGSVRADRGAAGSGPAPADATHISAEATTIGDGAAAVDESEGLRGDTAPGETDSSVAEAQAHLDPAVDDPGGTLAGARGDGEHPVATLMGHETLARLRARYAAIQARITEKVTVPEELEAMRSRAETLNPDRWDSLDRAMRGIERFEAEAEGIKGDLGRRPPRSRRTTD